MPPRLSSPARKVEPIRVPAFDFAGRRLELVPAIGTDFNEPSPLFKAIRAYLESQP
jgi:hypothetical protein